MCRIFSSFGKVEGHSSVQIFTFSTNRNSHTLILLPTRTLRRSSRSTSSVRPAASIRASVRNLWIHIHFWKAYVRSQLLLLYSLFLFQFLSFLFVGDLFGFFDCLEVIFFFSKDVSIYKLFYASLIIAPIKRSMHMTRTHCAISSTKLWSRALLFIKRV